MRPTHRYLSLLLGAILCLAPAAPAAAVGPAQSGEPIYQQGFETTYAEFVISGINVAGDPASAARWGRITNRKKSGSYGLYCAGYPTNRFPTYAEYTRGSGRLDLSNLDQYYSSTLEFWYTMPSLGAADRDAFVVGWREGPVASPTETRSHLALTSDGAFQKAAYSLSSPLNDIVLSRADARLIFQFFDFAEGPTQLPHTGQGVTIDDIAVRSYKYGPVRNLAAAAGDGSITVSWDKPYRSTYESVPDERAVAYRVWRSPAGADAWVELTSSADPETGEEYVDASAAPNTPYDYAVQAYDPVPGTGYGEWDPSIVASATLIETVEEPSVVVNASADKTSITSGGQVTFTYTVVNNGNVPLAGVTLDTGAVAGVVSRPDPLPVGGTWAHQETKTLTASVTAVTSVSANGGAVTDTAPDLTVTVTAAPVSLPSRIYGDDRAATAVEISKKAFPDAASIGAGKAVVIASAYGWADALPASSLAGALGGPLLLVAKDDVPTSVANEVKRLKGLGVTKAYVVGGDPVVGPGARAELKSLLGTTPVRVEGTDRYGTSYAVSEKTRALRDAGTEKTGGTAFVATGLNFPDALAASSLAADLKGPIVLTQTDAVPSATLRALSNLQPDRIVICGGTPAVGSAVEAKLKSIYGTKVTRKWGGNRYDTAKAIIDYGKSICGVASPTGIFLATGTNYPDALAGGVLAGIGTGEWKPLMLTDPKTLSPQAVSFIKANPSLDFATVLGGTPAVSDEVRRSAVGLVN